MLPINCQPVSVLPNLKKIFESILYNHYTLLYLTKLHAYDCDMPSSRFMQSDITYRYQWFKVNNSYGIWSLIKYEVPQGSILDPILFKIFLCEMFVLVDLVDIASYANDNDKVMLMIPPLPTLLEKTNQIGNNASKTIYMVLWKRHES